MCKTFLPVYSNAKIIKIERVFQSYDVKCTDTFFRFTVHNCIKYVRLLKIERSQNRLLAIAVAYESFYVSRPVFVVNLRIHVVSLFKLQIKLLYGISQDKFGFIKIGRTSNLNTVYAKEVKQPWYTITVPRRQFANVVQVVSYPMALHVRCSPVVAWTSVSSEQYERTRSRVSRQK